MKKTIYFDMDGVLANLQPIIDKHGHSIMYQEKTFLRLRPLINYKELRKAFKEIRKMGYDIGVLSIAVISPYCKKEKQKWLKMFCPSIDEIIILQTGDEKADYVNLDKAILVDDYGKNCRNFIEKGGIAIKIGGSKKEGIPHVKNLTELLKVLPI